MNDIICFGLNIYANVALWTLLGFAFLNHKTRTNYHVLTRREGLL